MLEKNQKIAIIGLGYVGLPIAIAFAEKGMSVVGYDIDSSKVSNLQNGVDKTKEFSKDEILASTVLFTTSEDDLAEIDIFIVTVPTPVDIYNNPDLSFLKKASELIGRNIFKGSLVIFESTVYPGVTREICAPIIESISGLKSEQDFKLGYSPERINPGDSKHAVKNVVKVVSGHDNETLDLVASLYEEIIDAGVFKASSIEVAEASKVIENTQRDLNIALMNELAIIFDKLNLNTSEVLEAAGTKWNFIKFQPGLVGGHCIGVDPYYLTSKAEQVGYLPQVILAGRRINDTMGIYIASKAVKLMAKKEIPIKGAKALVCGITFKENITDIRNTKVVDIINELAEYGAEVDCIDPNADKTSAQSELGIQLKNKDELEDKYDLLILAVTHKEFVDISWLESKLVSGGVFIDVKSYFKKDDLKKDLEYWSL